MVVIWNSLPLPSYSIYIHTLRRPREVVGILALKPTEADNSGNVEAPYERYHSTGVSSVTLTNVQPAGTVWVT